MKLDHLPKETSHQQKDMRAQADKLTAASIVLHDLGYEDLGDDLMQIALRRRREAGQIG